MDSNSKYVCHFTPDDKFIDMVLDDFSLLPAPSRVFVFGPPRQLSYIKYPDVEFVSSTEARAEVCSAGCAAVIIHSLTADCLELLKELPSDKLVVWLGWGYDYYDLLLSDAFPQGRFQPATRSLLRDLYGESFPGMACKRDVPQTLRDLLNRVDYFACLDTEYQLIKQHHAWFRPKLFWPWGYGHAEDNGSSSGNDILVGNSASPENNHLDVFRFLHESLSSSGRRIVVPLSYGDMNYRQYVVDAGVELFGNAFQPLMGYMDRASYFDTLSSCGYVFMNHARQQAVGNISSALLSGAHVFMNPSSPLYKLLREQGAEVSALDGSGVEFVPLSVAQRLINKTVALGTWGHDAHKRQAISLALLIERHLSQGRHSRAAVCMPRPELSSKSPFFSVVMPMYNRERYVKEAIESVLAQGDPDFELIVVDDGSTDRSLDIVGEINDPRLRLLRNQHGGGAAARNTGIDAARGEFIVWIDSDDRQAPGALAALRRTIQACPDADVYYGDLEIFDDTRPDKLWRTEYPDFYGEALLPRLIRGNCLPNPGTAVRRSLYQRYGGYDVAFVRCHDFHMWTRLADGARFKKVDNILCHWRQHGESLSSAKTRAFEAKVAQDMVERYPPSRLFPDLNDDSQGQGAALWRVSHIHQELGEPAQALRAAYRAQALGVGDQDRIKELERLSGSRYEPFFSVVLTTFNRPQLLLDALASLEKQHFRDFEAILVNDHGEEVEAFLARFPYCITYIRQGRNRGPAAARNAAHRVARGRYVVYLDDDDIFLPDHLQTLADALQAHPGEVVYTDATFVAERIENGIRHSLHEERRYPHGEYSRERLFVDNYIPVNTFAWPRAVAAEVGEFDETLSGLEDWDFLLRLAIRLPFHHVPRETVQVRMRVGDAAPDRRSLHAFKDYPALYRELYSRHPDLNDASVKSQRASKLAQLGQMPNATPGDIVRTWLKARLPDPLQQRLIEEHLENNQGGPRIGVLVLDLQGDVEAVTQTLASLRGEQQRYRHIEAKVLTVGDFGGDAPAGDVLIPVTLENYIASLNQVAAQLDCDWCLLVKAGECFTASGLLIAALELVAVPDCRAIYTDEIQTTSTGELLPILRPDFNLDLLLSFPASMGRHWLFRRDVFTAAGGFDHAYPDALEFELVLRLIEQGGLDGLGHVSEPVLITTVLQLENSDDEIRAIRKHLNARGYAQAEVVPFLPGRYRLQYGHATAPGVSIVIPAIAPLAAFQRCIESILEMTRDVPYELLLVARKEQGDEMVAWLHSLKAMGEANVRVLDDCAAKGLRASQNYAAQQARGDHLLFIAADTAVVMEDWLTSMLNHAQRPEVGAVGVKMVSSAGEIQHAGFVLGLQGPACSPFIGEMLDASGYMNRLEVDQNYSAVSGACLMIAREKFLELGGLDESDIAERWAELDLCLKARQAGYVNVWTPHVSVLKDGSDQPLSSTEQDALYSRWLPVLARDPAYNRNFSLVKPGGFKLADNALSWRPTSSWKPLPNLLVHPGDMFGCGHYRMVYPFRAMQSEGLAEGAVSVGLMHPTDLERYEPDVIILQRQIGADRIEAMRRIRAFSRAFKVYELDDYLPNLPVKSEHRAQMPKDIVRSLRQGLGFVDRFVVSTEPLADAFSGFHSDIVVMPNRLPADIWGSLERTRTPRTRMRVGWAGGSSHTGDLALIADVVKELAKEVDWVFFGMCPESLRPYVKEWHKGVSIEHYASTLAALDLDLAIAPLEHNVFNTCKSNLKLLEYGACGYPVVCTDIEPYRGTLPVTRVKNRFSEWVDAIRSHIAEREAAIRLGSDLRAVVRRDWLLSGRPLDEWLRAWTEA